VKFTLFLFCFSDNSLLSEEKQRILMLERVIYFHMYIFYWQALIIAFVKYMQLFIIVSDLTYERGREQET